MFNKFRTYNQIRLFKGCSMFFIFRYTKVLNIKDLRNIFNIFNTVVTGVYFTQKGL